MRKIQIKELLPYFAVVASLSGGIGWMYATFAQVSAHEKLEKRVAQNELESLHEKALSEVYFLRSQVRKYPADDDLKDQLAQAEKRLKEIESKIESNK